MEGVIHAHAVNGVLPETLASIDPSFPPISQASLQQLQAVSRLKPGNVKTTGGGELVPANSAFVHFSQRNTPALFGGKLIDEIPERVIIANERSEKLKWGMAKAANDKLPVGRAMRLANGKIGRFGWKAQTANLADFVQAACANELGLGNPGQAQPRPLTMPGYQPCGLDLTAEQCNQLTAFVASLPRPVQRPPEASPDRDAAAEGEKLFASVGCADCHTPKLGPVDGLYSDLLLHRMGKELVGGGSYNGPMQTVPDFPSGDGDSPQPDEWRTPPLWGVADSAPYLHDGRAATLLEAIQLHGGQGQRTSKNFDCLRPDQQRQVLAFLQTLRCLRMFRADHVHQVCL